MTDLLKHPLNTESILAAKHTIDEEFATFLCNLIFFTRRRSEISDLVLFLTISSYYYSCNLRDSYVIRHIIDLACTCDINLNSIMIFDLVTEVKSVIKLPKKSSSRRYRPISTNIYIFLTELLTSASYRMFIDKGSKVIF